jgi:hypothetical protein
MTLRNSHTHNYVLTNIFRNLRLLRVIGSYAEHLQLHKLLITNC